MRLALRLVQTSALVALLFGCDGSAGTDAGPPDAGPPAIGFEVTDAKRLPMDSTQAYAISITLEANTVGPLGVAANAFMLHLADGTVSIAAADPTNNVMDGCVSQSVALGESTSCVVIFYVAADAADPTTLDWSDGTHSASASVPPIHM